MIIEEGWKKGSVRTAAGWRGGEEEEEEEENGTHPESLTDLLDRD